jgi:hypothetical protein
VVVAVMMVVVVVVVFVLSRTLVLRSLVNVD